MVYITAITNIITAEIKLLSVGRPSKVALRSFMPFLIIFSQRASTQSMK